MKFALYVTTPGDEPKVVTTTNCEGTPKSFAEAAAYLVKCRDRWVMSGVFPATAKFETRIY